MSKPNWPAGRILLIDDDDDLLNDLKEQVEATLNGVPAKVEIWRPQPSESVLERFSHLTGNDTTLVVTDYDLTRKGPAGFFGTSIVSWCQNRLLPVGDYSRGNMDWLPKEPNVYEFRFPSNTKAAAKSIVAVYKGFVEIKNRLEINAELITSPSFPSMLARMLHRSSLASHFAQYNLQIGANANLSEKAVSLTSGDAQSFATYVLGHFLFNCILRYAGPIVDIKTLCAYNAVSDSEADKISNLFTDAAYNGPFSDLGQYFWREEVDTLIENWAETLSARYNNNAAAYRREIVEEKIGTGKLKRYSCTRCQGERGGYRCPRSNAVVCELDECSVSSSLWIPEGADLLRIERDKFDEEGPMLGR